jgi:hypothetical protein
MTLPRIWQTDNKLRWWVLGHLAQGSTLIPPCCIIRPGTRWEVGIMAADLLDGLNERQREAVTAPPGPVIVYAGPGSGKTRVLTHRLAYLVGEAGVDPGAVMAVTFTNKAAGEMRIRAEALLGGRLRGVQIGTFHAICARLLRREAEALPYRADYQIFDTDDQLSVVGQALNELNLDIQRQERTADPGPISWWRLFRRDRRARLPALSGTAGRQ